jgi:hypothetical protein
MGDSAWTVTAREPTRPANGEMRDCAGGGDSWRARAFCDARGVALAGLLAMAATAAHGQNPNQFGGQQRADAANEMIVLAVERGIASLPPTAGQSVTYEFAPASDAPERILRLGPTVLRSAQTIAQGTFTLRVAASYFDLSQSLGPINYLFDLDDAARTEAVAKLGLDASAHVGLLNLSATYGVTNRLEVMGNLPLTIVDASASQTFSTLTSELNQPPSTARLAGVQVLDGDVAGASKLLDLGLRSGHYTLRRESFTDLGFNFNDGTHAGVGRISLGAKATVLTTASVQLAVMSELFLPSPSQAEFAGSDSVAILPRVLGTAKVTDALRLYTDVGYEYDFDEAPLRRFTWSAGGSVGFQRWSADLGMGGSEYDQPILWTPNTVYGAQTATAPASTGHALQDNGTGTTVVDVLVGIKVRLSDRVVLAGGVTVPVVNTDFQPDVLGTIAAEFSF